MFDLGLFYSTFLTSWLSTGENSQGPGCLGFTRTETAEPPVFLDRLTVHSQIIAVIRTYCYSLALIYAYIGYHYRRNFIRLRINMINAPADDS